MLELVAAEAPNPLPKPPHIELELAVGLVEAVPEPKLLPKEKGIGAEFAVVLPKPHEPEGGAAEADEEAVRVDAPKVRPLDELEIILSLGD